MQYGSITRELRGAHANKQHAVDRTAKMKADGQNDFLGGVDFMAEALGYELDLENYSIELIGVYASPKGALAFGRRILEAFTGTGY